MTKQEREKIVTAISRRIREGGSLRLNQLYRVFIEEGLDRSLYGGKLKRWLSDNFPEFQIDGNNGLEVILFSNKPESILSRELDVKGKLLLASIPGLLLNYGIQYKELVQGKKLREWLVLEFPQFSISEDNLWLSKKSSFEEEVVPPAEEVSEDSQTEIRQMHAMVFMNWWNINARRLNNYYEDMKSENELKTEIAHRFAEVILGAPGMLIDAADEEKPRLAVDTGLKNKSGDKIYSVLMLNPKNADGKKQTWVLENFACSSDVSFLGEWLKAHCVSQKESFVSFSVLEEKALALRQKSTELIPVLGLYLEALNSGMLPSMNLADRLLDFEDEAGRLKAVFEQVWGSSCPQNLTFEQIIEEAGGKNAVIQRMENAVDAFDGLADQVHNLLAGYKLPVGENSTMQRDKRQIRQCCGGLANQADFEVFSQTLKAYQTLREVMSASVVTDELEEKIDICLCRHFPEISYRFAVRVLVGAEEKEWGFLWQADRIEEIVKECREASVKTADEEKAGEEVWPVTADKLLEIVGRPRNEHLALIRYAQAVYPKGTFEQLLILGRIEEALVYCNAYGEEFQDLATVRCVLTGGDFPVELSYYGAAMRLLRVIGNQDQLAEKYFLLGAASGEINCARELLTLYRESGCEEQFQAVFSMFFMAQRATLEEQIYYLSVLCKKAPGQALEFAVRNVYLLYQEESLKLLLSLPSELLDSDLAQQMRSRLSRLSERNVRNTLEQAVINEDKAKLHSLAEDSEQLLALGYSDLEIERFIKALEDEEEKLPAGQEPYKIGVRLYNCQGNRDALAEWYLWEGTARCMLVQGDHLLLILKEENRWEECCQLYECFEKEYSEYAENRQIYLAALLSSGSNKVQEYIRTNLQDCLTMIHISPMVQEAVRPMLESQDEEVCCFFEQVINLSSFLSDTFVKSVIFMDRMLREYTDFVRAKELGLPEKLLNTINSVYKSDNYAHGMDAVSISERTFRFFGNYKGVSEAFAKFSLPDERAVSQLWRIYSELEDEQQQFELLKSFPKMQTEHKELYLKLLFQKEKYGEFISQCDLEEPGIGLQIQLFIARLKLSQEEAGPLPDFSEESNEEELSDCIRQWGSLLVSALLEQKRIEEVEALLFDCFHTWLNRFSPETLRSVVTAENTISSELLARIQRDALAMEQTELALYLYNVLHIGQLEELSRSVLKERTEEIGKLDVDEKLSALQRLQQLYNGNLGELDARIALLKIQKLKEESGTASKEDAEKLGSIIESFPPEGEAICELLALLKNMTVCYNYHVYTNLAYLAEEAKEQQTLVLFFNEKSQFLEVGEKEDFLSFVFRFYVASFVNGVFPKEILEDTRQLCLKHIRQSRASDGMLCFYFVERALGQGFYADYLLRILAEQSIDMMGEELGEIVSDQIGETWGSSLPSFFDLFRELLNHSELEEIEQYIAFAHMFSVTDAGEAVQAQISAVDRENRILSESDSNVILKLLYAKPQDSEVWAQCSKLPLQDSPAAYAKLKYTVSRYNKDSWAECVSYCEKYEQRDLLLTALCSWAEASSLEEALQCRRYLEKQLVDRPDYFEPWKDREELLKLSRILCTRVKRQGTETEYHAALRVLSLIAVKTGFPEALDCLMDRFGNSLLGESCNLGVVTAVSLMLDRRFSEAHRLFSLLTQVVTGMNYREMVDTLAGIEASELGLWMEKPENAVLLRLVLPDGNKPGIAQINGIVYNGIQNGQAKETAKALSRILTMFPDDYGVYNGLFDLCCTRFDGYIPVLHQSLRGLIRLQPNEAVNFFYRRKQKQYAKMLAVLNALLIATDEAAAIPEYDFSEPTGDYYRRAGAASTTLGEAMRITEVGNIAASSFKNRGKDEVQRLGQAYLCCITGNWTEFLRTAWAERLDIQYEVTRTIKDVMDLGFARSVLRVLLSLAQEERGGFLDWLGEMLDCLGVEAEPPLKQRQGQMEFVENFVRRGCFGKLENQTEPAELNVILENPFEDYSFFSYFKEYVNLAVRQNSEVLYELVLLVSTLVCHSSFQEELAKMADSLFEAGNDKQACSFYRVLHEMGKLVYTSRSGSSTAPVDAFNRRKFRERYETRYRLTALFLNDEEVVEKVGSPDFHVWSCINLAMTLLYSTRADEVYRLTAYLAENRVKLVKAILKGYSPSIDVWEKLHLVDEFEDEVTKAYFCYVLKYPYPWQGKGENGVSYALGDKNAADEVNRLYLSLAKKLSERDKTVFFNKSPAHILILEYKDINPAAFRQKDPTLWTSGEDVIKTGSESFPKERPFFVEALEPLSDPVDVLELIEEHEKMQSLTSNIQAKYELSKRICQYRLGRNSTPGELTDAMLLLGVDCYYVAFSAKEREKADQTVLSLAKLLKSSKVEGAGKRAAENTIRNTALFELLSSFDTLTKLIASYVENRADFQFMRSLIKDSLLSNCVGQIYSVLDRLKSCEASVGQAETELFREELSESYRQLEKIEMNRWMDLKNRIQKLINDEINELDQRPVLQIEILNEGTQRNFGYLYGQVCNVGQETAEQVVLQANYNNNSHSRQYVLWSLPPGAKAVFEIDYGSAPGTERLEYYLNVAFSYRGKLFTSLACKGSLWFGKIHEPQYPTGILCRDPNGICFYIDEETKEVYSPEFIGRKKETAELRTLVEGEDFASCRSALIYGIRRTGKTSLLNYLDTYITANCPNIIGIKVDCQDMPAVDCIQFVFVDYVIDRLERQLPKVKSGEYWEQLKSTWYSPAFCADQHPEKLSLFYADLKEFLSGKGLYLIIDEIDRLFERVEERQTVNNRNLDSLFGAMSAMLNSAECRSVVHFVICGSNWLIRYNLKGDKMNQLFQRFGKQVIEVGKLPREDAREVLLSPYRENTELKISEEAVDWIWNYIGGLVWHTKLLGEEAIRRAKNDFRSIVYPSDVQQCLPRVLDDQWCKQFYEGCESGAEYQVVDAMQSLAAKCDIYIHINRISEMLGWELIEVQRTLVILKSLKVVEQHPIDHQLFRFEQDIYRRYFRTMPSKYKRIPEEPDVFQDRQQFQQSAATLRINVETASNGDDLVDDLM